MIPIERVEAITELDYKTIKMLDKLFGGEGNNPAGITLSNFLVVLVYDFFRRSGMTIERYSSAFAPFTDQFKQSASYIQTVIDQGSKLSIIPKIFVTVVDNRYIAMMVAGQGTPKLWDSVNERWVETTDGAPVFTLTLSVPALYFKVAAPHLEQTELANMFKHARTSGKESNV